MKQKPAHAALSTAWPECRRRACSGPGRSQKHAAFSKCSSTSIATGFLVTAFTTDAGELMAVVQTAILTSASFTLLRDPIFTHPTGLVIPAAQGF